MLKQLKNLINGKKETSKIKNRKRRKTAELLAEIVMRGEYGTEK